MTMPPKSPAGPAKASLVSAHVAKGDLKLPEFKLLRDLSSVDNEDELRGEMLARLEAIWTLAAGRARTVGKDQTIIQDPDGSTMVKVIEVASSLLGVKARTMRGAGMFNPEVFNQPAAQLGQKVA